MISGIYHWLHRSTSLPQERGQYSSGLWQDRIRRQALACCAGVRGTLLEVGCGEGLFLEQVCRSNPSLRCRGVDMSAERVAAASRRLSGFAAQVEVADATRLPFADSSFNAVVCVNVFFNMPSAETVAAALAQMRRVCADGGMIVFDFRNAANFLLRLKYRLAPWYDPTVRGLPLRTYTLEQVRALLERSGLAVREVIYLGRGFKRFVPIIMIKAGKK